MSFLSIFKKSKVQEIGKSISWKDSINVVYKIFEFDRNGTITDPLGNLKTKSIFKPYGYLIVENPKFSEKLRLPIIHKDDYRLAESVFDDPEFLEVVKTHDLLVTYRPMIETPDGLAGIYHSLHFAITPNGTLKNYYKKYGQEKNLVIINSIFIRFSWDVLQVQMNMNLIL